MPPRHGQPGRARRRSRPSTSSCWPRTRPTATPPPRTCAPTCAASARASPSSALGAAAAGAVAGAALADATVAVPAATAASPAAGDAALHRRGAGRRAAPACTSALLVVLLAARRRHPLLRRPQPRLARTSAGRPCPTWSASTVADATNALQAAGFKVADHHPAERHRARGRRSFDQDPEGRHQGRRGLGRHARGQRRRRQGRRCPNVVGQTQAAGHVAARQRRASCPRSCRRPTTPSSPARSSPRTPPADAEADKGSDGHHRRVERRRPGAGARAWPGDDLARRLGHPRGGRVQGHQHPAELHHGRRRHR